MGKLIWIFVSSMVLNNFTIPGVETPGYPRSPLRGCDLAGGRLEPMLGRGGLPWTS